MTKKLKLILALALVAVFAAMVGFILLDRPMPSDNRYFGLVKDVYTLTPEEWTPVELSGDTDVIPSASVRFSLEVLNDETDIFDFDTRTCVRDASVLVSVRFHDLPGEKFMLTTQQFERGRSVGGNSTGTRCTIEKLEDGEWSEPQGLVADSGREEGGRALIDSDRPTLTHELPLDASGTYRITYNFRTFTSSGYTDPYGNYVDGDDYTTGDELYTVSCVIETPEPQDIEPSERQFDLLSFTHGKESGGRQTVGVVLCVNYGEIPYLSQWNTRLEMHDGERWVKLQPDTDELARHGIRPVNISTMLRGAAVGRADGGTVANCIAMRLNLDMPDPDAQYRLVLEFTDRESGRGKEYPLTICFDLSREG